MTVRTLIGCCIMLTMIIGCGKSKESDEKSFKESYQKNFVSSCTESAIKGGATANDAKNKCECIAAFLVNKYSSSELIKLKNTKSPENKKILDEAINSCR